MKATETNFLQFIQGNKQFVIPIYQRTYSWTQKQCKQIWEDIIRVATNEEIHAHFIGSIVYIKGGIYQVSTIPKLLVIDGQQRLTTLSLLLVALAMKLEESKERSDVSKEEIESYYLLNKLKEGDLRYKLILTQSDEDTLKRLVEGRALPPEPSQRIIENYQYYIKQIENSNIPLATIYRGLSKLVVVDVSLDRTQDNPQLIFESLNSTGLDLSQADLIRNYILMGQEQEQQIRLYQDFWFPMEQSFGYSEYTRHFDRFMRDYLTIKNNGVIPKIGEVYQEFKAYVSDHPKTKIKEIVQDIHKYSKHFTKLAFQKGVDSEIRNILFDINSLRVDVAYPFLMQVFEEYSNDEIIREELVEILKLVETYVLRRVICGIPTNSLNKTFANLYKEIDREKYLESVSVAFLTKDSYRRLPTNEEFRQEFIIKDIYNLRTRNYLLRKLENYGRKEPVDIEEYTIEHILPQNENLSETWQRELGGDWQEVQKRYLHTIGNLTLTGYNPELNDRPFKKKQNMVGGFGDSPIRLNRMLASLDIWNEEKIKERADELSKLALQIWSIPDVPKETIESYKSKDRKTGVKEYSLADYEYLEGEMLELFNALRHRVLNLDSSVSEEYKKQYIAYKNATNFLDIVPQKNRLRLSLNMLFDEINDPKGLCRDVTNVGRWGNGDVEVGLSSVSELDYVIFLARQSFEKQMEETI